MRASPPQKCSRTYKSKCSGFFIYCVSAASLLAISSPIAPAQITVDISTSTDQSTARSTIATPPFSTSSTSELLLAFVSADSTSGGNTTVTGIAGGGLTWVLVRRTNAQSGTAEIWRAFATTQLSNATATATLSRAVAATLTVMAFKGTDSSGTNGSGAIGQTAGNSARSGAPTASLTTTRPGSLVIGVGNDYDNAVPRTVGSNQVMIHQYLATAGDTYWVQSQSSATALQGTTVTINDTAPAGDRYNLCICEIVAAGSGVGMTTYSIQGNVSAAASGASVSLSGSSTASTNADASGNYTFSSLPNGTYTITPAKTGYTFIPNNHTVSVNNANVTAVNFTVSAVTNGTISGTVSPSSGGSGTIVMLSGTPSGYATAASNGGYSFTNLPNGMYTVTPTRTGYTFSPPTTTVVLNGSGASGIDFAAQAGVPQTLKYPDLSDIIPPAQISIKGTGASRQFQYTHDTFNGGIGPLEIQPVYNAASGNYQGIQHIYTQNGSNWTVSQSIPIAGAFVFDAAHGHFHFPFAYYGLYAVNPDGTIGSLMVASTKEGFCIDDSFVYDSLLPNAGAFGNWGSCSNPTSLRGLSVAAVDEYDQTDEGQSISLAGVPDGTYWLRAIVDPQNFIAESNKTNNETDVKVTISGNSVQVIQLVKPVLANPPAITLTYPAPSSTVSSSVPLSASTPITGPVQFLVDGLPFGSSVTSSPYTINWDTSILQNGTHWLAVQITDPTGVIGTSPVVSVTVANSNSSPPTVVMTDPAAGSTVSAVITLTANAASQSGVPTVQFYVDGNPVGASVNAPPYLYYWNTQTVGDGPHVISATATNSSGLTGTSSPVSITADNSRPADIIGIDAQVSQDGVGSLMTSPFSTATDSAFVVAFVGFDGPDGSSQTATVSGAGLTWTLLKRSNAQNGTAEIWAAKATDFLTNASVTAVPGTGGYHGSITVVAFKNAAGPGIAGQASASTGAPDVYLPGVLAGNWVFAVGNDWDRGVARTPSTGQVLVHQWVDTSTGDTYWVQSPAGPAAANALVDIHDTAPTNDRWNYAAVEVVATRQ